MAVAEETRRSNRERMRNTSGAREADVGTATKTVGEMRELLVAGAAEDEEFRARLIAEPNAAIEERLGLKIPAGFAVKVLEDDPNTVHLVLPPTAALDEADLAQAAGGIDWAGRGRAMGGGWGNRGVVD